MSSASVKSSSAMAPIPRTLLSIAVFLGGLAMFLFVASVLLVTHPIGSKIRRYFYGVDTSNGVYLGFVFNQSATLDSYGSNFGKEASSEYLATVPISSDTPPIISEHEEAKDQQNSTTSVSPVLSVVQKTEDDNSTGAATEDVQLKTLITSPLPGYSGDSSAADESASSTDDSQRSPSAESVCDLNQGSWFYDPSGPLYTNNTCPVIAQMQNCQGNGRPDKEYENWRWRPSQCELPRFDVKKFLELMSGKTLAFVGDSVGRNQMESLLCILWQVEVPKNRGNKRMQRWYFRSKSVMIVRLWSSWLVHQSSEPLDFAPEGVTKLHLDAPDKNIMEFLPSFDVVVLSSGHWFAKQSAYVLNNEIVGGQLWWPDKSRPMKVNNVDAFGISVETIFSSIAMHPNFTGLAILRSYSPDHYEGGAWNTGGSCTGKIHPLESGNLVENGFTNVMHMKQVTGFDFAMKKAKTNAKLRLMDITESFGYRHDGHPGPYRSPDPNKITKRGLDGRPPPQDCLHWCMPGPVDTWNEIVLEIIRREYESN